MSVLHNQTRGTVIATDVRFARTIGERTRGLLDWEEILPGQALVISPCKAIHMFGMRFPIDVLFVGRDGVVLRAIEGIKPGQMTRVYFRARLTIELPVGAIRASKTAAGDVLQLPETD